MFRYNVSSLIGLAGGCACRETDAGLVGVGSVWNAYDKLLQGMLASWRSYLQLPSLKFHIVQVRGPVTS